MTNPNLTKAYDEGYSAWEYGLGLEHNPYPKEDWRCNSWINGWIEADREYLELESEHDDDAQATLLFCSIFFLIFLAACALAGIWDLIKWLMA